MLGTTRRINVMPKVAREMEEKQNAPFYASQRTDGSISSQPAQVTHVLKPVQTNLEASGDDESALKLKRP